MAVLVRILSVDALKALQCMGYSDSSKAATICGQLLSICTLFMVYFIEGRHMLCDKEFTANTKPLGQHGGRVYAGVFGRTSPPTTCCLLWSLFLFRRLFRQFEKDKR
jgi:hypothetical protein